MTKINPFDWTELDGKTLEISVGKDVSDDGVSHTVIGFDASTGNRYVLHSEYTDQGVQDTRKHYIADEALGGIEREYVEVEREAEVGDIIVIVEGNDDFFYEGDFGRVTKIRGNSDLSVDFNGFNNDWVKDDGKWYLTKYEDGEYITLSPTDIVRLPDGNRYELQDRVAEEGECILVTNDLGRKKDKFGKVFEVLPEKDDFAFDYGESPIEYRQEGSVATFVQCDNYLVLKPVDPTSGPSTPDEIIANLVRRVAEAEAKLAELTETSEMLTDDVVKLDARTQPEEIVRVLAEDMAKRAVEPRVRPNKSNGGDAE